MLDRIIQAKHLEVQELIKHSDSIIKPVDAPPSRLAREVLCHPAGHLQVIAELKKASPTRGLLRNFSDPVALAVQYQEHGAAVISVLSDKQFFAGSKDFVASVSSSLEVPVLRKDFILHEIQLYESRNMGARLVLLIAALHDYASLLHLAEVSLELGLEPLVEVHDSAEIDMIRDLPVQIVGVNNRNLKTFEVSLKTSLKLGDLLDSRYIKVSESGIKEVNDMALLEGSGYHAALIGEGLVTAADPGARLSQMLKYREVQ